MNIDVKNAFDKVIVACDSLSSKSTRQSYKKIFADDIFAFISMISISGSEMRSEYFNKIFFSGEFNPSSHDLNKFDIPCLLTEFLKFDSVLSNKKISVSGVLIDFFIILGRSYILDAKEKKEIDVDCFTKLIRDMETYVSKSSCEKNNIITEYKETTEKIKNTGNDKESSQKENSLEFERTLEELLDELDSMIGLSNVKNAVKEIINVIKVQNKAKEFGIKNEHLSNHLVFYGNPGTGKTTIARLLAEIYKSIGVLSKGQLIEVDRSGLVGGYVGQTAIKTREVIDKALGGILFIDEAYTLTYGKGENDFGQEAVDTILKAMEDNREDFIVIVAGYTDLMKEFISSNPGLKSRFNQYISFEDYKPDELKDIFCLLCKNHDLILVDECHEYLENYFTKMYESRGNNYGNGRDVRNFFEKVIKTRANRIADVLDEITKEDFKKIVVSDLEEAVESNKTI